MKRYDYLCQSVAVVTTALQTQQLFQIISLVLTCLSIVFSMTFTLYKWFKEAKKDGKIDKEEIDEVIEENYFGWHRVTFDKSIHGYRKEYKCYNASIIVPLVVGSIDSLTVNAIYLYDGTNITSSNMRNNINKLMYLKNNCTYDYND